MERRVKCAKCGSERLKQYGERLKCLDCAKTRSSARRKGDVSSGGRPSKTETRAKEIQVAAFAGGGRPLQEIARATGYSKDTVSRIVNNKLPHDEELKRVFLETQATIAPLAAETLKNALERANDGVLNGYEVVAGRDKEGKAIVQRIPCPPDKAATVAREAHAVGWDYTVGKPGEPGGAPSVNINVRDPAVMKAMIEALRTLNEPTSAAESTIETAKA